MCVCVQRERERERERDNTHTHASASARMRARALSHPHTRTVMKTNGASGLCLAAQNGHADVVQAMCAHGGAALVEQADNKQVIMYVCMCMYDVCLYV